MDATSIDPRTTAGSSLIPGDAPSGTNIRYEPEFAELSDKIARMDTEGPLAVNWVEVVELGCDLLRTRSKDLLIGVWVTLGLARTERWRGLSVGLQILAGMIEHHWPGLEPPAKRERARVQMLEWIVERTAPLFAEVEPVEADWLYVIGANTASGRIESLLEAKLTKETAAMGDLARLLRERARSAERGLSSRAATAEAAATADAEPAAPPPAAATLAPAQVADDSPASVAESSVPSAAPAFATMAAVAAPSTAGDIDAALSRLQTVMQTVARGVQAADPADPRGYALLRAATWLAVAQPPMNTNGVTPLPPPPSEQLTYLAGLQQAGDHLAAIDGIEETFAGAPFWFDAHRMTCRSLAALGPTHESARLAVLGATAALLRRLPKLLDLSFSDRKPLADTETKEWVAAEVLPAASGEASGRPTDPVETVALEARQRAMTGRPRDGLVPLLEAAAKAASGRERFRWLLAQAEYCLDQSIVSIAILLLDHLDEQVVLSNLEAWEPAFAIKVSVLMHRTLLHGDAQDLRVQDLRLAQLESHRARLCRLDIVAAADALKL